VIVAVETWQLLATFSVADLEPHGRLAHTLASATTLTLALLLLAMRVLLVRESRRTETIAECLTDGLLCTEGKRITFANSRAQQILAETPAGEIPRVIDQASTSSAPIHYTAIIDGKRAHYLVSKVQHVVVFKDVTFLRENEEAKVTFIGTLSHEIRTPVTSLALALAMLQRTGYDPDLIRVANQDVARLRVLLEELLNVSRLKIVRNPNLLQKRSTSLSTLFRQAARDATTQAASRGVRLVTNVNAGAVTADIDPPKLSWVMATLLTDAIRLAAPGAEVRAELGAVDASDGGARAVLTVRFHRATGDGPLSGHEVVRDIIKAHGGEFIAVGKGDTVFRFTIQANFEKSGRPQHEAHPAC
jgi:signal transduction histidine kinase